MNFDRFRTPIDDYFSAVLRGDPPNLPRQPMPARLADIIGLLARSSDPSRCELASFLLDAVGDFRDQFAGRIEDALRENKTLHRARPLSVYGGMAMTLYVWSPSAPRQDLSAEQHARAVMVAANETSRRLIELEYTDDGLLVAAHMTHVSLSGLGYYEVERVKAAAVSLQQQRLRQALAKGKIGRNAPCPCGSGSKYKRCHGRRA